MCAYVELSCSELHGSETLYRPLSMCGAMWRGVSSILIISSHELISCVHMRSVRWLNMDSLKADFAGVAIGCSDDVAAFTCTNSQVPLYTCLIDYVCVAPQTVAARRDSCTVDHANVLIDGL